LEGETESNVGLERGSKGLKEDENGGPRPRENGQGKEKKNDVAADSITCRGNIAQEGELGARNGILQCAKG